MSEQRVEHPASCPRCGGQVCLTRATGVWVAHCRSQHKDKADCQWAIPLPVDYTRTGGIVFVATPEEVGDGYPL